MINKIEQTVKKLSGEIWTDIKAASDYKLSLGEESITDKVLLELARLNSSSIRIETFTKHEERKNGADFFWIIGTGNKWTSFLIQAKKIEYGKQIYSQLYYKSKDIEKTQLQLLNEFSTKTGILACYCFYNSEHSDIVRENILCTKCEADTSIDINILGWTITSVDSIKKLKAANQLKDAKKFKEVHKTTYETIPLSCLFHKLIENILNKDKDLNKNKALQKTTDSPEKSDLPWYENLNYTDTAQSHYDKIKNIEKDLPKSIVIMDIGEDVHLTE